MDLPSYYWLWIVIGMAFMALEIVLPTFMMLWFGVSAVIVGAVLFIFPSMSITAQVLLWTALSVIIAVAWFKFLRPLSIDKTKAGLSREAMIGQTGMVIQLPQNGERGKLRLPAPILGSDEWQFFVGKNNNDTAIALGDRVRVVEISGNSLVIEKQ